MNNKANYLIVILLAISNFAAAQKILIKGEVKNTKGQPVPVAFVRDASSIVAAFADSSGNFLIKTPATGALTISAPGYGDTQVALDGQTTVSATLSEGAAASSSIAALPSQINNNPDAGIIFLTRQDMTIQNSGTRAIKEGYNQEPTKGSPYLFQGWANAYAIGTDNKLLYDIANLYNYDKITGQVVFTKDKASLMQVNKGDVKQIFVYDGKLFPHIFESNPAFTDAVFVELMVNSAKGKLYKQTTTKLVRANFHTDGVIESGHKYDEYVDAVKYYFIKAGDIKPKSISLKRKALKEVFAGDADKFMDNQGSRDIDDDYLQELNASLN